MCPASGVPAIHHFHGFLELIDIHPVSPWRTAPMCIAWIVVGLSWLALHALQSSLAGAASGWKVRNGFRPESIRLHLMRTRPLKLLRCIIRACRSAWPPVQEGQIPHKLKDKQIGVHQHIIVAIHCWQHTVGGEHFLLQIVFQLVPAMICFSSLVLRPVQEGILADTCKAEIAKHSIKYPALFSAQKFLQIERICYEKGRVELRTHGFGQGSGGYMPRKHRDE